MILNHTTITQNQVHGFGAGVDSDAGFITINNSLIVDNTRSFNNSLSNCTSPSSINLIVDGSNLSNDLSCDSAVVKTSAEINLGPLSNSGGTTHTHALLSGSVAIDAAVPDPAITADQRGVSWPQGSGPDIGAFEPEALSTVVYVSSASAGTAGGVTFTDEDILSFNTETNTWTRYFDGSDVGLGNGAFRDVDAFTILDDGSILLSVAGPTTLPDVGSVDDSDILRFVPAKFGPKTEGAFEMYFDGSDVNLTTVKEDIDALVVTKDGQIIISTLGAATVVKQFGNNLNALDEDLLIFTPITLGENTSGYFSLYLDGSDLGLNTPEEDVWGIGLDASGSNLYINPQGSFDTGAITGLPADFFICEGVVTGNTSSCAGQSIVFDGAANGVGSETLGGIHVGFE
ncbi:MAG: choice-of-anchor Q domain-containing protein [Chloroflexota bacterium]